MSPTQTCVPTLTAPPPHRGNFHSTNSSECTSSRIASNYLVVMGQLGLCLTYCERDDLSMRCGGMLQDAQVTSTFTPADGGTDTLAEMMAQLDQQIAGPVRKVPAAWLTWLLQTNLHSVAHIDGQANHMVHLHVGSSACDASLQTSISCHHNNEEKV